MKYLILFFFLLFSLPVGATSPTSQNMPNPKLTPGEIATSDLTLVCKHGYSKSVRKTTREMKRDTYRAYGMKNSFKNKIDHLVPLSLGGADSMKNIWPSVFGSFKYNADAKDRLELRMRDLVCHGKLDVHKAQKAFMDNWQKAYDTYCPTRLACPSFSEIQELEMKDNFHFSPSLSAKMRGQKK